jgi:hypothetical protein
MKSFAKVSLFVLLAFSVIIAVSSCKDDPVVATATINITSLAAGATIEQGDTVHIAGTITTDGELHGYEIYLRNKTAGTDVFTVDEHVHGTTLTFDEHWVNNVTAHSEMELEVVAVLSHEGDVTVSKKVNFHCHP